MRYPPTSFPVIVNPPSGNFPALGRNSASPVILPSSFAHGCFDKSAASFIDAGSLSNGPSKCKTSSLDNSALSQGEEITADAITASLVSPRLWRSTVRGGRFVSLHSRGD